MTTKTIKGRSLWSDARRRFFQNKAAVGGLIALSLVVLISFVGPYLSTYDFETIDFDVMGSAASKGMPSLASGHFFGTDDLGRDIYARVLQGTRVSLAVGVIGASIAVFVGVIYGTVSGYTGGKTDQIMMRLVDILMSIPFIFVLILMLVIWGRSMGMLFFGIGLLSWLGMSRVVRGQTLTLKNKEFVEAARAIGVSTPMIIWRHIIPNLLGIVAIFATLMVPEMILTESFLSFLGLGVQEPYTSWGALIDEGSKTMQYGVIWQLLFPLAFFVVTLFSFFFIGDGLRDALDPKDR